MVRDWSAVRTGRNGLGRSFPNVETLGYCRMSIRDEGVFRSREGDKRRNPSGIGGRSAHSPSIRKLVPTTVGGYNVSRDL